jgi:superfamily II DNA or RNA helicase
VMVIPTAGGKSLVQATIIKRMLEWDNTRVLLLTHQSELIKQNYIELTNLIDDNLE